MNARGAPSIAQQKSRGAPLLDSPRINTKPIIYLNINVLQLSEINTVAQQFSCEFVLRGWSSGLKGARAWVDPTLAAPTDLDDPRWNDESYSRPLKLEEYDPRLAVSNLVGEAILWRFDKKWIDGMPNGEIEFKWRIKGVLYEPLEIENFPRDLQLLRVLVSTPIPAYVIRAEGSEAAEIRQRLDELATLEREENEAVALRMLAPQKAARRRELRAWRKQENRVQRVLRFYPLSDVQAEGEELAAASGLDEGLRTRLEGRRNIVQTDSFGMSSGWELLPTVVAAETISPSINSADRIIRGRMSFAMCVARRPEFFMWNIEVPMAVLTSLTAMVFTLPGDAANQLSLCLALVLTAVAYKLTVASHIPVVSYLTQLDAFVSTCFLFMVLAVVQVMLIVGLAVDDADADADLRTRRLNHLAGGSWSVLWVGALATYGYRVRTLKQRHADAKHRFGVLSSQSTEARSEEERRNAAAVMAEAEAAAGGGGAAKPPHGGYEPLAA